jgi:polyisoprenyl-phosphate glycosyltransferase
MTTSSSEPGGAAQQPVSLSVVVPLFNEVECLDELYSRIVKTMESLGEPWELILVDDGSTDGTIERVEHLAENDARVRPVVLVRNFGHQIAVTAGLDYSRGQAVIAIDADLQDPPELIPEFVERWREGFKVVAGVRTAREDDTLLRRMAIPIFYRIMQRVIEFPITLDSGDYRLLDREVVEVMKAMPERHRFLRGMSAWTGFRQTEIRYDRSPRYAGRSKYPVRKLFRLAFDGITSFSYFPLKLMTMFGFFIAVVTGIALPVVVALRLAGVTGLYGQTTTFLAVMFFGGVQILCMGILGDYLGRVYDEVKARPLYLVSSRTGSAAGRGGGSRLDAVQQDGVADLSEGSSILK